MVSKPIRSMHAVAETSSIGDQRLWMARALTPFPPAAPFLNCADETPEGTGPPHQMVVVAPEKGAR